MVATCSYCGCDRLACPWGEAVRHGSPLICGKCGSLAVFEVDQTAPEPGTVPVFRWRIRQPTADEGRELRADDQVAAWLKAYDRETLRRATAGRRGGRGATGAVNILEGGLPLGFKMKRR